MARNWRTRMAGLLGRGEVGGEGLELCFYTRADCPLCDAMEEALAGIRWRRLGVDASLVCVQRRDVDSRESWRARYGWSVPVIEYQGRALAKGRATREELEIRLARRLLAGGKGATHG